MRILNPRHFIAKITQTLQKGGVVLMPFDTSYGLACDAKNKKAVEKIYQIKQRSLNKPLSVVMRDLKMIEKYAKITKEQKKILKEKLPGLFTFIVELKKDHPVMRTIDNNNLQKKTIAVRLPDFQLTKKISQNFAYPYTATSANLSSQPNCYSIKAVLEQIKNKKNLLDLIIDFGELPHKKPSTIIDLTGNQEKIIRK